MTTIDVKQTVDIYDLIRMCWGSAKDFLEEVLDAEKDDLLMDFLNDIYQDGGETPDLVELNDLFTFDQDELKKRLGHERRRQRRRRRRRGVKKWIWILN